MKRPLIWGLGLCVGLGLGGLALMFWDKNSNAGAGYSELVKRKNERVEASKYKRPMWSGK